MTESCLIGGWHKCHFEDKKKRCHLGWGHVRGGRESSEGRAEECWDSRMREQVCFVVPREGKVRTVLLVELGGKAEEDWGQPELV